MTFRGFRVQITILVFVVVVAVGLVGKYAYEQTQVISPLQEQLLGLAGVESASLEGAPLGRGRRPVVSLELDPEVPLSVVFGQVRQVLAGFGGEAVIHVQDSASPELVRIFDRVRIAAEEAIMTGEFTVLEERVQKLAQDHGIAWELAMDRDFVYVSLGTSERVLRRVINRGTDLGGMEIYMGGGAVSWENG